MKKLTVFLLVVVVCFGVYVACVKLMPDKFPFMIPSNEQSSSDASLDETTLNLVQFDPSYQDIIPVVIQTNYGSIHLDLYPQKAPKAVENFTSLAKLGYYNGLFISASLDGYLIQSANPEGKQTGESIWGEPFETEIDTELYNFRGAIGMASSEKDMNLSQFYIVRSPTVPEQTVNDMERASFPSKVISKYKEVGGAPWLDGSHTVFGQVTAGLDIIDKIAAVGVNSDNLPLEPIVISQITF